MNTLALEQKLQTLSRYPILEAALVRRIGDILRTLDDWSLFRINPLRFATEHNLDPIGTVDFFVHGAKVGLFDFAYNTVCPGCGAIEYSYGSLDQIAPDMFHCTVCNGNIQSNLDEQVQVMFMINPSVANIQISPYINAENYRRYFFAWESDYSPQMAAYVEQEQRGFVVVQPDQSGAIAIPAKPNTLYRAMSIETHSQAFLHIGDPGAPASIAIDLLPNGIAPSDFTVPAGEFTLHVHNRLKSTAGVLIYETDFDTMYSLLSQYPNIKRPYLTGKMLLNNQSFRDLFRIQALAPDLKLNVRSLTIMFTDLKNSTDLYSRIGDVQAYELVLEHFDLLTRVTRRHAGSIVKTMGDAIMATFSNPQDGIMAALDMVQDMEVLKKKYHLENVEFGIKIGLNEGPALAVNADERLDYFGQSVNVAARVQNLAQAGEIWITETVYNGYGVREMLESCGCTLQPKSVALRGVNQEVTVYQCVG